MEKFSKTIGIPISSKLEERTNIPSSNTTTLYSKRRLVYVAALSVMVAAAISIIAKLLVCLINIVTNFSFYGLLSPAFHSPAANHLGIWVVIVPAIGGLLVGFMSLYGSKAIRGHGIPEAMEQILINQSKIKPSITFLKPISSALAIGTGGPFGAEGPIIATGGALGSTLGQLLKVTSNERKIILAAGATAGMSAIFGTPIAAIFLAIELLLFEFSPRAILPVALACITGAAGHHLLFETAPVFPMPVLETPSNGALALYSFIGLLVGFISLGATKIVYITEDAFEKLPIHWMWWPALGGLAVGVIGYFAPNTLGVGYDNIVNILSGTVTLVVALRLFFFKFLSWAIALGSGTSGGTLAPLLTIGGAGGALSGMLILYLYPGSGISIPMAALAGMSAMFAGASRAYLTSITFALEATGQPYALLPLLGACTASYMVSFFLMENTIMTEKIARRGVFTPDSYEPDLLSNMTVGEVIDKTFIVLNPLNTIKEVRNWLALNNKNQNNYYVITNEKGIFSGIVKLTDIYKHNIDPLSLLGSIVHAYHFSIYGNDNLRDAVEKMSNEAVEELLVVDGRNLIGILFYKDVINAYKQYHDKNGHAYRQISLKRQRLKMILKNRNK